MSEFEETPEDIASTAVTPPVDLEDEPIIEPVVELEAEPVVDLAESDLTNYGLEPGELEEYMEMFGRSREEALERLVPAATISQERAIRREGVAERTQEIEEVDVEGLLRRYQQAIQDQATGLGGPASFERVLEAHATDVGLPIEELNRRIVRYQIPLAPMASVIEMGRPVGMAIAEARNRGSLFALDEREREIRSRGRRLEEEARRIVAEEPERAEEIGLSEESFQGRVRLEESEGLSGWLGFSDPDEIRRTVSQEGEDGHQLATSEISRMESENPELGVWARELQYDDYGAQNWMERRIQQRQEQWLAEDPTRQSFGDEYDRVSLQFAEDSIREIANYATIGWWAVPALIPSSYLYETANEMTFAQAMSPRLEIIGLNNDGEPQVRSTGPGAYALKVADFVQSGAVGFISEIVNREDDGTMIGDWSLSLPESGAFTRGVADQRDFMEWSLSLRGDDPSVAETAFFGVPGFLASVIFPDVFLGGAVAAKVTSRATQAVRVGRVTRRDIAKIDRVLEATNGGDVDSMTLEQMEEFQRINNELMGNSEIADQIDPLDGQIGAFFRDQTNTGFVTDADGVNVGVRLAQDLPGDIGAEGLNLHPTIRKARSRAIADEAAEARRLADDADDAADARRAPSAPEEPAAVIPELYDYAGHIRRIRAARAALDTLGIGNYNRIFGERLVSETGVIRNTLQEQTDGMRTSALMRRLRGSLDEALEQPDNWVARTLDEVRDLLDVKKPLDDMVADARAAGLSEDEIATLRRAYATRDEAMRLVQRQLEAIAAKAKKFSDEIDLDGVGARLDEAEEAVRSNLESRIAAWFVLRRELRQALVFKGRRLVTSMSTSLKNKVTEFMTLSEDANKFAGMLQRYMRLDARQANSIARVWDAIAHQWAARNNRTPNDFWRQTIDDIDSREDFFAKFGPDGDGGSNPPVGRVDPDPDPSGPRDPVIEDDPVPEADRPPVGDRRTPDDTVDEADDVDAEDPDTTKFRAGRGVGRQPIPVNDLTAAEGRASDALPDGYRLERSDDGKTWTVLDNQNIVYAKVTSDDPLDAAEEAVEKLLEDGVITRHEFDDSPVRVGPVLLGMSEDAVVQALKDWEFEVAVEFLDGQQIARATNNLPDEVSYSRSNRVGSAKASLQSRRTGARHVHYHNHPMMEFFSLPRRLPDGTIEYGSDLGAYMTQGVRDARVILPTGEVLRIAAPNGWGDAFSLAVRELGGEIDRSEAVRMGAAAGITDDVNDTFDFLTLVEDDINTRIDTLRESLQSRLAGRKKDDPEALQEISAAERELIEFGTQRLQEAFDNLRVEVHISLGHSDGRVRRLARTETDGEVPGSGTIGAGGLVDEAAGDIPPPATAEDFSREVQGGGPQLQRDFQSVVDDLSDDIILRSPDRRIIGRVREFIPIENVGVNRASIITRSKRGVSQAADELSNVVDLLPERMLDAAGSEPPFGVLSVENLNKYLDSRDVDTLIELQYLRYLTPEQRLAHVQYVFGVTEEVTDDVLNAVMSNTSKFPATTTSSPLFALDEWDLTGVDIDSLTDAQRASAPDFVGESVSVRTEQAGRRMVEFIDRAVTLRTSLLELVSDRVMPDLTDTNIQTIMKVADSLSYSRLGPLLRGVDSAAASVVGRRPRFIRHEQLYNPFEGYPLQRKDLSHLHRVVEIRADRQVQAANQAVLAEVPGITEMGDSAADTINDVRSIMSDMSEDERIYLAYGARQYLDPGSSRSIELYELDALKAQYAEIAARTPESPILATLTASINKRIKTLRQATEAFEQSLSAREELALILGDLLQESVTFSDPMIISERLRSIADHTNDVAGTVSILGNAVDNLRVSVRNPDLTAPRIIDDRFAEKEFRIQELFGGYEIPIRPTQETGAYQLRPVFERIGVDVTDEDLDLLDDIVTLRQMDADEPSMWQAQFPNAPIPEAEGFTTFSINFDRLDSVSFETLSDARRYELLSHVFEYAAVLSRSEFDGILPQLRMLQADPLDHAVGFNADADLLRKAYNAGSGTDYTLFPRNLTDPDSFGQNLLDLDPDARLLQLRTRVGESGFWAVDREIRVARYDSARMELDRTLNDLRISYRRAEEEFVEVAHDALGNYVTGKSSYLTYRPTEQAFATPLSDILAEEQITDLATAARIVDSPLPPNVSVGQLLEMINNRPDFRSRLHTPAITIFESELQTNPRLRNLAVRVTGDEYDSVLAQQISASPWFHGTQGDFNVFDYSLAYSGSSYGNMLGPGMYLAENPEVSIFRYMRGVNTAGDAARTQLAAVDVNVRRVLDLRGSGGKLTEQLSRYGLEDINAVLSVKQGRVTREDYAAAVAVIRAKYSDLNTGVLNQLDELLSQFDELPELNDLRQRLRSSQITAQATLDRGLIEEIRDDMTLLGRLYQLIPDQAPEVERLLRQIDQNQQLSRIMSLGVDDRARQYPTHFRALDMFQDLARNVFSPGREFGHVLDHPSTIFNTGDLRNVGISLRFDVPPPPDHNPKLYELLRPLFRDAVSGPSEPALYTFAEEVLEIARRGEIDSITSEILPDIDWGNVANRILMSRSLKYPLQQRLMDAGVDGVLHHGRQDKNVLILFDPRGTTLDNAVESLVGKGRVFPESTFYSRSRAERLRDFDRSGVDFADDGRATIRAMEAPDLQSVLRIMGRILRRNLSSEELDSVVRHVNKTLGLEGDAALRHEGNRFIGNTGGVRTQAELDDLIEQAEDVFSDTFASYISIGSVPDSSLTMAGMRIKNLLGTIVASFTRGTRVNMSDEMRDVFDKLLAEVPSPTPPMRRFTGSLRKHLNAAGPDRPMPEVNSLSEIQEDARRLGATQIAYEVSDETGKPINLMKLTDENLETAYDNMSNTQTIFILDKDGNAVPILNDMYPNGQSTFTKEQLSNLQVRLETERAYALGSTMPRARVESPAHAIAEVDPVQMLESRLARPGVRSKIFRGVMYTFFGGDPNRALRVLPPLIRNEINSGGRVVEQAANETLRLISESNQYADGDLSKVIDYLVGDVVEYRFGGRPVMSSGWNSASSIGHLLEETMGNILDENGMVLRGRLEEFFEQTRIYDYDSDTFTRLVSPERRAGGEQLFEAQQRAIDLLFRRKGSSFLSDVGNIIGLAGDTRPQDYRMLEALMYFADQTTRDGRRITDEVASLAYEDQWRQRTQILFDNVRQIYGSEGDAIAARLAMIMSGHGHTRRAIREWIDMGLVVSEDVAGAFKRWAKGEAIPANLRPQVEAAVRRFGFNPYFLDDPLTEAGYHIPEQARRALSRAVARSLEKSDPTLEMWEKLGQNEQALRQLLGSEQSFIGVFGYAYRYMKLRMTRGAIMIRPRYFLMNTIDHFNQVGMVMGLRPAIVSSVRMVSQNALALPLVGKGLRIIELATHSGLNPTDYRFKVEQVRRLLQSGGDVVANALGRMMGIGKYQLRLNDILEGKPGTFKVTDREGRVKIYSYQDIRKIMVQEGIFASFDTSALGKVIQQTATTQYSGWLGSLKSITQDLLFNNIDDISEGWAERERAGCVLTLINAGYDPRAASRITIDALYDYAGTMTEMDKSWLMSMLFPFWAYQKNANRQVFNLAFSPRGAYRMGVMRRYSENFPELVAELLWSDVVDPYGVNYDGLNDEQQAVYDALRMRIELGYGPIEDLSDAQRIRIEDAFDVDDLSELTDEQRDLVENGYGRPRDQSPLVRTALMRLFAGTAGPYTTQVMDGRILSMSDFLELYSGYRGLEADRLVEEGEGDVFRHALRRAILPRAQANELPQYYRDRTFIPIPPVLNRNTQQYYTLMEQTGHEAPWSALFLPKNTIQGGFDHLAGMMAFYILGADALLNISDVEDGNAMLGEGMNNALTSVVDPTRAPFLGEMLDLVSQERMQYPKRIDPLTSEFMHSLPFLGDIVLTHPEVREWFQEDERRELYEQGFLRAEDAQEVGPAVRPERHYIPAGMPRVLFENMPLGELDRLLQLWRQTPLEEQEGITGELKRWARTLLGADIAETTGSRTAMMEEPYSLRKVRGTPENP